MVPRTDGRVLDVVPRDEVWKSGRTGAVDWHGLQLQRHGKRVGAKPETYRLSKDSGLVQPDERDSDMAKIPNTHITRRLAQKEVVVQEHGNEKDQRRHTRMIGASCRPRR